MNEFELIRKYFQSKTSTNNADIRAITDVDPIKKAQAIRTGIGDDCAVFSASEQETVISTDTLVEGRHFPRCCSGAVVASRALGSAVSDLAAMGAQPLGFTLSLSLPAFDDVWLTQFSNALFHCSEKWQIPLVGGDTVRGPLVVTVTVLGRVDHGQVLFRTGADTGNDIWVSGSLGDAAGGLAVTLGSCANDLPQTVQDYLRRRFEQPEPRLQVGAYLTGIATAAIDISDGLLADLGHILKASGRGAVLRTEILPIGRELKQAMGGEEALVAALTGGDDYELCFTASARLRSRITDFSVQTGSDCKLTRIGTIVAEPELAVYQEGKRRFFSQQGYKHFDN